ncbi:MAG: metallophosphoesterase, partial [Methylobacter sp.]
MEIILHLTDLHFGSEGDKPSSQAQRKICLDSLLAELAKLDSTWKPTFICITGDLVWRGAGSDYDQAKQWLDKLLLACELTYEQLIICVGNHEVDRKLAERLPRPSNAEEADSTLALPLPDFLQQPFLNFIKFCEANNIPILNFGDTESYLIGIREYRGIKFLILNSCWFSKDNQDKGKLWMGFPHLQYMEANSQLFRIQPDHVSPPVTIALMHHPVTWLHEEEQHAFQTRPNTWDYLAMRCDVLLTGHTHGESRRADQIAEGARHFTGGATYADANYFNSFRLLKIEHENIVYRTFDFNPRSADIAWKPSNAVSLPIRQQIQATQASPQVVLVDATDKLREALRADAERQRDRKSRLLRPTGSLPSSVPQQVSLQVSRQIDHFDSLGRMLREDKSEYVMPLYEAVRESRRTLLLGDLGTGKSTLAAQLVIETLDRSVTTVAVLLPVKNLKLPERLSLQDLLQSLDAYISGEVMPDKTPPKLFDLLQSQTEVLVVFDGLDELSRDCAGRLLSVAAKLTEHWPTIQIVATARPVEMHGVSFADWQLIHTTALQETGKFQFLLEELIADGVPPELAKDEAQALLRVLKELPTLNSLTVTPLVIRMIYPRLDSATTQTSFSLGDLLYELLIERLNGWQQRDDKPVNFTDFEAALPTAEAKAEFLAVLAQKNASGISITSEAARSSLMDAAAKLDKVNPHALVDQALTCFKWLGLIALSDVLEFPLQPLAEMAAAIALVKRWREEGTNNYLPNNNEWRIVSFAAAMIRRRLWLDELIQPLKGYIGQLLQNPHNVPAACYVVVEANDANYAKYLIQAFSRLGYHPLVPFEDERIASSRNIAKALWLAGTEGFDWLFGQYLDPKYPLPHAGSRTIHDVFYQWAKFAQGNLDTSQKQRLSTMVMPYLATGEANFFGVLGMLSLLVPEAFGLKDRLWYQLYELDSPTFGDGLLSQIRLDFFDPNTRPLLEKILLHRAPESAAAALLWLELNPDSEPPVEIIRASFRYLSKTVIGNAAITLSIQCRQRLGQERWLRFARWMLSDGDNSVACGAALTLHEVGENRLSLLGDVFMRAMHDGGYMAVAEKIMAELINGENDKGINWLINRLEKKSDSRFGGHSGYWRLLLANIARVEDGPDKLAGCLQALGQFVLPRYPEVREAFSRLLNGSNGSAYRHALRKRLHDLDPTIRSNAARILVATDPGTESEALFVTVRSRAVGWHHDLQEWESFCLTLDFSPAVLGFLQSHMNLLEPQSIAFAWVLLAKGKLIELDFQTDWINTLFDLGNWHLLHDPICQDML